MKDNKNNNNNNVSKDDEGKKTQNQPPFNPLFAFLYFKMGLLAWKNYTQVIEEKKRQCVTMGIPYTESPDESSTDPDQGESGSDSDDSVDESESDSISHSSHSSHRSRHSDSPFDKEEADDEDRNDGELMVSRASSNNKNSMVASDPKGSRDTSEIVRDESSKKSLVLDQIQGYAKGMASRSNIARGTSLSTLNANQQQKSENKDP